jgi:hypothetical protein
LQRIPVEGRIEDVHGLPPETSSYQLQKRMRSNSPQAGPTLSLGNLAAVTLAK